MTQTSAQPGVPKRPAQTAGPRPWFGTAALFVATWAATWALFEFVILSPLPPELLGAWVVEGGEHNGTTFTFHRTGNVIGKEGLDATARVEGDVLHIRLRKPMAGQQTTWRQTILSVTGTDLVLEDEQGETMRMRRTSD